MQCLEEPIILELAEGHLTGKERERALNHIGKCERCKRLLRKETVLNQSLKAFWDQLHNKCPDVEALYEYLSGHLKTDRQREIETHITLCASCKGVVQDARIVWDEIKSRSGKAAAAQPYKVKEQSRFVNTAREIAKAFITTHLPDMLNWFDDLWRIAYETFESIQQERDGSDVKDSQHHLAIALAAAGMPEVEFSVASLSSAVTLRVCERLSEVKPPIESSLIRSVVAEESKKMRLSKPIREKLADMVVKKILDNQQQP